MSLGTSVSGGLVTRLQTAVNDLLRRMARVEDAARRALSLGQGGGGSGGGGQPVNARAGTTSSSITAKSGTVCGTGTVVAVDVDAGGNITTAETLTVWNFFAVVIPTSTDVFVEWFPDVSAGGQVGVWLITQRFC